MSEPTVLSKNFYKRDSSTLAKDLLGKQLARRINNIWLVGKIVETEAYYQDDPASHSFRGMTDRTKVMFENGGLAYVYFTYGIHYCFNVVAGKSGHGEAVLIRALEPLKGIEIMKKNRGIADLANLTNGPAKLTKAFKIDKNLYGVDLTNSDLQIWDGSNEKFEIVETTRIGISIAQEVIARYYVKDNPFVSRK